MLRGSTSTRRIAKSCEAQARERLGVLAVAGRSQGALLAMRRNLLRERLKVSE